MKILLLGEYSNVHWTLAEGLRLLGHEVCVVSNGDFWKNYNRDISLVRKNHGKFSGVKYFFHALKLLPELKGYDVVQVINPMFLELKAERILPFYKQLRRQNGKMFLGAFGIDSYWVKYCMQTPSPLLYSDFNVGGEFIDNEMNRGLIAAWRNTEKERLNNYMAKDVDGIIAGLYEYHAAYKELFGDKLVYIPFPVKSERGESVAFYDGNRKMRFFIGVQRTRNVFKGSDIMLRALERLQHNYPESCEIIKAESVPFEEYSKMVNGCDVLLDQLYGYSPAMNALLALAKGKVVVGGAEEECYEILNEHELRPMVNVRPSEDDVYMKLENLVLNKEKIARMQEDSLLFIERHHSFDNVARRYIDFWEHGLTDASLRRV